MLSFFINYSYYFLLLIFIVWCLVCFNTLYPYGHIIKAFLKANRIGILCCFVLILFLFISAPTGYRVLADETNIVSVSKSMTFCKKVNNNMEGYWYYNNFWPLDTTVIDKRPLLFPFFTSIIHTFTGYRPENVFVLNFFLLFGIFLIIYLISAKYLNYKWSLAILVAVASQPIVSILGNAGSLEIISVFFLLASLYSLYWFLIHPSSGRLAFLWVNLLMYLNTRYEAIVPIAIVLLMLLFFRQLQWRYISGNWWLYAVSMFLILPVFMQRILVYKTADELPPNSSIIPFHLKHVVEHSVSFLKSMFDYSLTLPYANILNVFGLIAIVYFLFLFIRKSTAIEKHEKQFIWIVIGIFGGLWLVTTSYHAMLPDHPSSFRVYLPFLILLSVLAILLFYRSALFKQYPIFVVIFSLSCFLIYVPISIDNRFSNTQNLIREYDFISNFLSKQGNRNFLLIYDRPNLFTVNNYGAISFERANREVEQVLSQKKRHLFNDIFVVQFINYETLLPDKGYELSGFYNLEIIKELQTQAEGFFRISRVINTFQEK